MTPETPDDTPAPDLRKAPPSPDPEFREAAPESASAPDLRKAAMNPAPVADDAPPASIWQPLDGSAPQLPPVEPLVGAWSQPHQGTPPPGRVAAAYVAANHAAGQPGTGAGVFTLASWGRRLGAYLIDGFLFGLIGLALAVPVGLWQGLTVDEAIRFFGMLTPIPDSVADPVPLYVAAAVHRLLIGMIPAFFLASWNGQTPGKRALGIRVMRADGGTMDLRTAMRRELLGRTIVVNTLALLTLGIAGVANYLWPLWDQQRRTGHDAIGGTRVVTAPPQA